MQIVGLTLSVLTDDGSEAVVRIQGSPAWAAERLAHIGGHLLLCLPLILPGECRRFEYVQGSRAN